MLNPRNMAVYQCKFCPGNPILAHRQSWLRHVQSDLHKVYARTGGLFGPFPDGKYNVIVVDPPWKYKRGKSSVSGAADRHYRCLSLPELKVRRYMYI